MSATTGISLEQAQAELAGFSGAKNFSPLIEPHYRAHLAHSHAKSVFWGGLAALALFNLFIVNDYFSRPNIFLLSVVTRLLVVTPLCVLALWQVRQSTDGKHQDAWLSSGFVVVMLGIATIHWFTRTRAENFDPPAFVILLMTCNVVMPLRFRTAALITGVSMLIFSVEIGLHPGMEAFAKRTSILTYNVTGLLTLLANHRLNKAARFSYLVKLCDQLQLDRSTATSHHFKVAALTDDLTQLPNRRHMDEVFQRWQSYPPESGKPMAALIIDVDHFKQYNDTWGHLQGDVCLREVARVLMACTRAHTDLAARLGGEEFVVLLRQSDAPEALSTAERIRQAIEAIALPMDTPGPSHHVTASIGVALAPYGDAERMQSLLERADQALYQAKRHGRNRTEMDPSHHETPPT
ncbi:GGDEF domain-containing protein [Hydrogenophaga soli]